MSDFIKDYEIIRNGGLGFYKKPRGLFEVSGGEAIQFLNGLITNDVATMENGAQMLAAFPTLKGRVFAVVRVMRRGDKFLFETEEATRQKVYDNLFRFTFAGDFYFEDLSDQYEFYSLFGDKKESGFSVEGAIKFQDDYFVARDSLAEFEKQLEGVVEISNELYEVLRIENGIPKYGIDMDEDTVVPELNLDGLISYQKGCYIGQEVIARIYFKGKPAKQLRGLVFESEPESSTSGSIGEELRSIDGKSAGKITSVTFSPAFEKTVALGYVRNAFLETGTELKIDESIVRVSELPFDLE